MCVFISADGGDRDVSFAADATFVDTLIGCLSLCQCEEWQELSEWKNKRKNQYEVN